MIERDSSGVAYMMDVHLQTKLESIFKCKLKAVYSKWDVWDKSRDKISSKTPSKILIVNLDGVEWWLSHSEWFEIKRG